MLALGKRCVGDAEALPEQQATLYRRDAGGDVRDFTLRRPLLLTHVPPAGPSGREAHRPRHAALNRASNARIIETVRDRGRDRLPCAAFSG